MRSEMALSILKADWFLLVLIQLRYHCSPILRSMILNIRQEHMLKLKDLHLLVLPMGERVIASQCLKDGMHLRLVRHQVNVMQAQCRMHRNQPVLYAKMAGSAPELEETVTNVLTTLTQTWSEPHVSPLTSSKTKRACFQSINWSDQTYSVKILQIKTSVTKIRNKLDQFYSTLKLIKKIIQFSFS